MSVTGNLLFVAAVFTAVTVTHVVFTIGSVTEPKVQATMQKYGCKPTNEFVGKDAQRLYTCADGLKYTYGSLHQLAFKEKERWNE